MQMPYKNPKYRAAAVILQSIFRGVLLRMHLRADGILLASCVRRGHGGPAVRCELRAWPCELGREWELRGTAVCSKSGELQQQVLHVWKDEAMSCGGPGRVFARSPSQAAQRLLQVLSITWRGGQPSLYLPKARVPNLPKFGRSGVVSGQKTRSSEFVADAECCRPDTLQQSPNPFDGSPGWKWDAAVLGKDGRICGPPNNARGMLRIDPAKGSAEEIGPDLGDGDFKWGSSGGQKNWMWHLGPVQCEHGLPPPY